MSLLFGSDFMLDSDTSALSENPEPSSKRRNRACNSCKKRKIKCDGSKPLCGHCRRRNLLCYFPEGPRERKQPWIRQNRTRDYIEKLGKQVEDQKKQINEACQRISELEAQMFTLQPKFAASAYGTSPYALHSAPLLFPQAVSDKHTESHQIHPQIPMYSHQTSHKLQYQPQLLEAYSLMSDNSISRNYHHSISNVHLSSNPNYFPLEQDSISMPPSHPSQTHPLVTYGQASMEIQAMTATTSLVESGQPQVEDIIDTSDGEERIPLPDLGKIYAEFLFRDQNSPAVDRK